MIHKLISLLFLLILITGCKDDKQSKKDDVLSKVKTYLVNDYLKDDIKIMTPLDKKFQMVKVDLNDDGKDEIFIQFISSYFCGTGGCTFLLLDNNYKLINHFTVTRAPIFAEKIKGKWAKLYTINKGELKVLEFKNGKYPSNPSIAPNATVLEPKKEWIKVFSKDPSKLKVYTF